MALRDPSFEQLETLRELNGLFLAFLQTSVLEHRDSLDLPKTALPALSSAESALLDAVAQFPRALFRFVLDGAAVAVDPLATRYDSARYAVQLSVLLAARTLSRGDVYHARLLFGLDSRTIQTLRGLSLAELQTVALAPRRVVCAFQRRAWLWRELLTETRPEGRQRLALLALQPGLERDWPQRRNAHLGV